MHFNHTALRPQTYMVHEELFWSPYQLRAPDQHGQGGTVLAILRNEGSVSAPVFLLSLPCMPMELIRINHRIAFMSEKASKIIRSSH